MTAAVIDAHPDNVALLVAKGRAYLLRAGELDRERGDPQAIMGYCGDADLWIKKALAKVAEMHSDPKDDKSPTYGELIKASKLPGGDLEESKKEPKEE